ncbi:uncharacterized protein LOC124349568 isoform X1 [Daphnia pulicaria]|uniref:uncharacterized protein LOC124349568 isoform X1 n=1 Tax=Daphnia pulicaria TaxID=35523 RepID=UPI001EEA77DC|nr:uncharacterized protein LOC124349568 isoform X1 [Daphnia pulicaria]XP_046656235.1 uncharacterized protein LOC124349568 isoform X1 [Daphnia pulicaria]XP_046656236.1 uncharacterized protein LOC124349568 isoform X1 [Daphnia pulicaria]XP_046656237.1 uncharacterized protein LOC124349568 isoform X1 [Daphnia pulicaria]XP_046656238.1 uncharacterized protein LOC124349568 isoform X1 [Daphnia pulicaria]
MTTSKCDLCFQDYDFMRRRPKFLMCFHSFCLECLQKHQKTKTVINCPTCLEATNVNSQSLDEALKTNFYILDQMKDLSASSAIGSSNEKVETGSYYWCSSCYVTFKKGADSHPENHETYNLDTEDGREIAEIHLKTLLVTCKSQWNGALSKHQEADLALKATETALQALEQQIRNRRKKNDWQMEKLANNLSEVAVHLNVPASDQQRTSEKLHNLFQLYNKLIVESKAKAVKTGNKLAAFSSLRNAVVSMDIKTSKGEKFAAPLFDSALINFPSEAASSYDSYLLTTLAFLVLSGNQNGQRTNSAHCTDQSESLKLKKNTNKAEIVTKERKNVARTEAESSKSKNQSTGRNGKGERNSLPVGKPANFVRNHDSSHPVEKPIRKLQPNVRPPKQDDSVSRNSARRAEKPHGNTCHVPSIPIQPLFNKKAFFVLAVNGKEYGSVVIELRPDVAPVMCQRFVASCLAKSAVSYQGTIIYDAKPKTYIMGGRVPGPETLYMADASPLKKMRGAVFFRLKRDFMKSQCSIVATDFCIRLGEDKVEHSRTSTVFGFVCDGLAVCDAISHMDCKKEHVALSSVGIVG